MKDSFNNNAILDELQGEITDKFLPKKTASQFLSVCYGEMELFDRCQRVDSCGSYLEYVVTENAKNLHKANFCHDRLCPMCNWRRSLKIFGQVSQVMDALAVDGNYRYLFLTLTVKSCEAADLGVTVDKLFSGWRWLYNKSVVFQSAVCGSFRSLEVTRNKKTGLFHPHLHCILAVLPGYFSGQNYLSQVSWCELWQRACGLDYEPIIDVRSIKDFGRGVPGAVAEVSKYAVKSSDFLDGVLDDSVAYIKAFLDALSNRRLCSFTGCFAKARAALKLDDIDTGDLVHVDGEDLRPDVAFCIVKYGWRAGCYVRLD